MNKKIILAWAICLLGAVFYSYDFLLRVMPSVMIHPLMQAYQANAAQIGLLSAFYYYAYTPLQLPAGVIVDKYSPRWVLSLSALLCAIGAFLFASTDSFVIASVARLLMGVGSAFAFVGALKLAAIWLPKERFALFAGITSALGILGAVLADNVLSYMVAGIGWQQTSYLCGLVGVGLAVLLFLLVRHKKSTHASPDVAANALNPEAYMSWREIFKRMLALAKNPSIWVNGIVGAMTFLPVSVFASLWGVDFFARRYPLDHTHAASAISLVFIGAAVASPIVGHVSDAIKSRRIPLLVGNVMAIILSCWVIYLPNVSVNVAYGLLFFIGVFTAPQILVFAIAKDLSPPLTTGIATAITNFIVTIGAALFQPLIGYVLDMQWQGAMTSMGTPLFTISEYQVALSLLVVSLGLSLILIAFLPSYHATHSVKTPKA